MSQVGIYFGNRYGRRPRPDEVLDSALKGMDDRWAVFHYTKGLVDHLLTGPGGIWLLKPYHQMGTLVRNPKNGRWQMKGGGILQAYLRIFAQESIGRPDLEIQTEKEVIRKFLKSKSEELDIPDLKIALVMTNMRAEIADEEIDDGNIIAISAPKLKEIIRKRAKENSIPPSNLAEIQKFLAAESQEVSEG